MDKKYINVIDLTYKELEDNKDEILKDVKRYANKLTAINRQKKSRIETVKEIVKKFNTQKACLDKYINVDLAMKGTPTIILRFYGREVARVYFDKKKNEKFFKMSPVGKVTLKNAGEEKELRHLNQKFKKTFDNNDLEIGKEYKWNSREGENFRSIFANKNSKNELTLVNEHYLESQLLKDLSSKVRKSKSIPHIQPIKYHA